MKCPYCGAEVTGRFCSYCGSELPKKEPNVHIEHNETIINNYSKQKPKTYGTIYQEEQMRDKAREEIARKKTYEENRKKEKSCLVNLCIWIAIIIFVCWKVSSWWNGLFDDGIEPIVVGSEEYQSVINIDDNLSFANKASEKDEDKWYRITCAIDENRDDSLSSIEYGVDDKYFYGRMEEGWELEELEEGVSITFVGHLDTVSSY